MLIVGKRWYTDYKRLHDNEKPSIILNHVEMGAICSVYRHQFLYLIDARTGHLMHKNKRFRMTTGKHTLLKHNKRFRYSLLASAVLGLTAGQVNAQDVKTNNEEEEEVEIIDVRGTRADLFNAQNIKRFSETVVDALDASDIGGFPDRSVLEAISRLPGITMGRFAAPNDPDHFGTEGSGVVIRGLTHVRSE